jgi:hypothetical protein
MIDQKVAEKVQARDGPGGDGQKKRPLGGVAKEVGIPEAVQLKMGELVDGAKLEVFELFRKPREDGSSYADDLVEAMKSGDAEKGTAAWTRMFKENVPGTDETYFAAAIRVSEATMKEFEKLLTPEQFAKYKHTGVGPLDLETGYDPWAEYWKQKNPQR